MSDHDVRPVHPAHTVGHTHAEHAEHAEAVSSTHAAQVGNTDHSGHEGHADHPGHAGHAGHADHVAQYRRLFWIMLVLAIPVVAFNQMFAHLLGYTVPGLLMVSWISPVVGTVMYLWGGRPFLTGAVSEIRSRKPGMMLLIALAITVAFIASWGSTLGILGPELDFWWELALLVVIMLLGHWIEMRSLAQTSTALESLAALLPDEAELVDGDIVRVVAPADLRVGDLVVIRPGGRVPADGVVTEGTADVDESMVTGESRPVSRGPGAQVVAGTVATDTALRVTVTAVGDDTALAGIQKLVSDAQNSSSPAQRLADKAAGWLFWFALGAAVITAIVWTLIGNPDDAVVRTITVLVIACPHALGLAIPLVVAISTERAAKAGVLIKDRMALESMRNIDTVLFDKTGTLTQGEPVVAHTAVVDGTTEEQLLGWAAAAEGDSEHPLAKAIVRAAQQLNIVVPAVANFQASAGIGVTATVGGRTISVGGPSLLRSANATAMDQTHAWADEGATILHVLADGEVVGSIALTDKVRPESQYAVQALQARGIQVVMITGDAQAVANSVAAELGIERVFAGVHPQDKAAKVAELQREGRRVAMVGDGVNDAPALLTADVGIAIGAGTDVAVEAGDVVLVRNDPRDVARIIALSKATYRKMVQNLWWAAGYNVVAIPLAAGVLANRGVVLGPAVGAVLMSASTVVVALNAQLLRRAKL